MSGCKYPLVVDQTSTSTKEGEASKRIVRLKRLHLLINRMDQPPHYHELLSIFQDVVRLNLRV